MTTQADVKRLVKPLLSRHAELKPVQNGAIITPIRHLIRKVSVSPYRGGDHFAVYWLVFPLFYENDFYPLSYSEQIFSRTKLSWRCSTENVQELLRAEIEEICLPALRQLETVELFCQRFEDLLSIDDRMGIYTDAARGDLERAEMRCERVLSLKGMPIWSDTDYIRAEYDNIINVFYPLVKARDRKGIGDQLRRWELGTARALKIDQYWEPTPFPVEEEG